MTVGRRERALCGAVLLDCCLARGEYEYVEQCRERICEKRDV